MRPDLYRALKARYGRAYNEGGPWTFSDGGFSVAGHWENRPRWAHSALGIMAAVDMLRSVYLAAPAPPGWALRLGEAGSCQADAPERSWGILDVGCGRGALVRELRALGANAFGVDIGQDIREPGGAVAWASRMPFASGQFDVVVALDLVEHLPPEDQAELLAELVRVGAGLLLVTVPTELPHYQIPGRAGARNHYMSLSAGGWGLHWQSHGLAVLAHGPDLAQLGIPWAWGAANYPFALEAKVAEV